MKIPKYKGQPDWSTIIYNTRVTLSNIPEQAYRYQLGARSAIEWIIDRYRAKTDTGCMDSHNLRSALDAGDAAFAT